ncbi:MAG: Abi family protein [Treponema sp.]|nr:Abi family protein [Treponema sp.]
MDTVLQGSKKFIANCRKAMYHKSMQKHDVAKKSPKLTVAEIIEYCKDDLGITFNLMDEDTAAEFLKKHNYFFRLKQYAEVCQNQTRKGKYTGLDFGHLVELSTIDMFLRKHILKMTIDFEHYLKVKIVNDCQENPDDDGYSVVDSFLEKNPTIKMSIIKTSKLAGYNGFSIDKYLESPAVWNFIEMIGFFDFIKFYSYYYDYFHLQCKYTRHFDAVRRLRNAAAHNVCLLYNFNPVQNFSYDMDTSFELLGAKLGIGQGTIASCMKVPLLNDFAVMLSVYTQLVTSEKVRQKTLEEIKTFFDGRMLYRKQYFEGFPSVKNAYNFARAVLEWYSSKAGA